MDSDQAVEQGVDLTNKNIGEEFVISESFGVPFLRHVGLDQISEQSGVHL